MAIFGGNGFGGLLGSILGGGAMRSGIAPGDNDWLEEFRKRMGLPGGPVADTSVPAPQPQQRGGGFLGGIFGGGGNWGDRLSDIGQRLGEAGAYFDGDWETGAAINQARNYSRDAAIAAELKRQQNREDYQWRMQAEADFKRQHPEAPSPYRFEDNAGNVWQYDAATGENKRIFTDRTERVITDPATGAMIRVPNPYADGVGTAPPPPETIPDDVWNTGRPLGGGVGNGTGGFPRRRR